MTTNWIVISNKAIVKIDDTVNGIHEGTLAGCWTVGVAKTSSYVGLNEQQLEEVSEAELNFRLKRAYDSLMDSGAHYVIDTMKDLPLVINYINRRLAAGEKPWNHRLKFCRLIDLRFFEWVFTWNSDIN